MRKTAQSAIDQLEKLIEFLLTMTLAVFCVAIAYNIGARMLDAPRPLWAMDVAQYSFIWMVFLGAAVAVRRGAHFTIDLIPATNRQWMDRTLTITSQVLLGAAAMILLVGGIRFASAGVERISTASGLQLIWAYAAVPVAAAVMVIFVLEKVAKAVHASSR